MAKKKRRFSKKRKRPTKKVSQKRHKEEMERGQVWSVDVLLAVVIFIAVILVFYVTMTAKQKPGLKDLEIEAVDLKIELEKNPEFGFIVEDEVDSERFQAFIDNATYNYTALKEKLGIKGDFCLFYEDSNGNLILIGNRTGIGASAVSIGGYPCGSAIS